MKQSEAARLAALAHYGVLDTAPEEAFDRLTRLACDLFDAPIALVSLVDQDRQWFKSKRGVDIDQTPRSWAFCAHAIEQAAGSVMVIEDARADPRFVANPLVSGEAGFRFYMGAVLTDPDGHNLGTLCVIDHKPRSAPSPVDIERLRSLAAIVVDELALRRASRAALERQHLLELAEAGRIRAARVADEEARRAALAEAAAGLGYWRLDLATQDFTGSDQLYHVYGLELDTPLSLQALRAMAHQDTSATIERIDRVAATGQPADRIIICITRADGEVRHLASDMTAERDSDGRIIAVVGTLMDVTDQENDKAALVKSEERFRRLAMNASDIVCEIGLDGVLTFVSPAVLTITGYAPDEVVGRRYASLMNPEHAATIRAMMSARGSTPPRPVEFRSVHRSGREIWLECQPTPVLDPATGQCVGITDVVRDVTARKQLEAELRQARAAAETAAVVKGEFLANMSHELRTPLTGIIGYTRLAAGQPELSSETRAYIERAGEASRALLCTVNDILDFSKLEAGKVRFRIAATPLAALCQATLELLAPLAQEKALDLALERDPAVADLVVDMDPDRVRQILLNLVGNALKFTDAGAVTLRVGYDCAGQRLAVEIVDTGPGVPADRIGDLFKRFSQVDGSRARAHGGAGLGLAICKGLVEAMGGDIGVDSTPGEGSRFWFAIPAPVVRPPRAAEARGRAEPILAGLRVLVVDDHAANRQLAQLFLSGAGAEVSEAVDGETATDVAARGPFDVILMDLRMPGLDGVGALRRIREGRGPNAGTAIVAFTADVDEGAAERLTAIGFQGMVAKPMEPLTLIGAVARVAAQAGVWDGARGHA